VDVYCEPEGLNEDGLGVSLLNVYPGSRCNAAQSRVIFLSMRAPLLYFGSLLGVFAGMVHAAPLDGVEMVMGPLPKIDHGAPLDIQIQETARLPHYILQKLTFVPEPGSVVHAWLLTPNGARNAPAVLCLHQTTEVGKDEPAGLGGNPNLHYAQELALRGYVTLAPDYMHFGEDKTNLRAEIYDRGYQSGSMKGSSIISGPLISSFHYPKWIPSELASSGIRSAAQTPSSLPLLTPVSVLWSSAADLPPRTATTTLGAV
jgi:hypothetical protein